MPDILELNVKAKKLTPDWVTLTNYEQFLQHRKAGFYIESYNHGHMDWYVVQPNKPISKEIIVDRLANGYVRCHVSHRVKVYAMMKWMVAGTPVIGLQKSNCLEDFEQMIKEHKLKYATVAMPNYLKLTEEVFL